MLQCVGKYIFSISALVNLEEENIDYNSKANFGEKVNIEL